MLDSWGSSDSNMIDCCRYNSIIDHTGTKYQTQLGYIKIHVYGQYSLPQISIACLAFVDPSTMHLKTVKGTCDEFFDMTPFKLL